MMIHNKFILYMRKRDTSLLWLVASATLSVVFLSYESFPYKNLETIGKNHEALYCIFVSMFSAAIVLNGFYTFRAFKMKFKFLPLVCLILNIGALFTSTAITYPEELAILGSYAIMAHWIFLIGSIFTNAVCMFFLCLAFAKKFQNKFIKYFGIFVLAASVLCAVGFVLITFIIETPLKIGNALFVFLPMLIEYMALYIINHTDLITEKLSRDDKERNYAIQNKSNLVAFGFGSLIICWCVFTAFFFCRSPIHYTLAMVGVQYPVGYTITCLVLGITFIVNFNIMFRRHKDIAFPLQFIAYFASAGMLICALGIRPFGFDFSKVNMALSVVFFTATMFVLTFFTILESKSNNYYGTFAIILWSVFVIVNAALILLYYVYRRRYGLTGLTELIPAQVMLLYFYLENYEEYFILGERKALITSANKND